MPSPPPSDVTALHDTSDVEVESLDELAVHLARGSLAGLTVQGLRLDSLPTRTLTDCDLTDSMFIGCRLSTEATVALVRKGAHVVPAFPQLPYVIQPSHLYTADELAEGFDKNGFAGMADSIIYEHFRATGGATPAVREALTQRLHDHGIDNALADTVRNWIERHGHSSIVGVMGGHAERRGSSAYWRAAALGRELTRAGKLIVTGGGPGVMEAANLGSYLASRPEADLLAAVDILAGASDFRDHDPYTAAALRVRRELAPDVDGDPDGWAHRGGLSIPTWLYGHEPANLFAGAIAKYFSNAIREDTILRLARGGIVFAAGRAGTVQEVFQAATKTYYGTDGVSGAYVFLDHDFWTNTLPIEALLRPLLALAPDGNPEIHITDDVQGAVAVLLRP